MTTIYTVHGEKGEYSDWTTWPIAGHYTKDSAEQHAKRLNDIIRLFVDECEQAQDEWEQEQEQEAENRALAALAREGDLTTQGLFFGRSCWNPAYSTGTLQLMGEPK